MFPGRRANRFLAGAARKHFGLLARAARKGSSRPRTSPHAKIESDKSSMIDAALAKIFGTKNEREIKAMRPIIAAINDLEPSLQQLSDIDLAPRTIDFREQLNRFPKLRDILIPAFATAREAG